MDHLREESNEGDEIDFPIHLEEFCKENDLVIESLLKFVNKVAKYDNNTLKAAAQACLDEVLPIFTDTH